MRLTPIEIRRYQFHTRVRGFDREEVRTFLEMIIADFEDTVRENAQLRRETERLTRELDGYRGKEHNIHEAMTTAQGIADDLKHTALKEAECVVAAAELQARKIVQEAEVRKNDLDGEIGQLQQLRRQVGIELQKTLEGYLEMLASYGQGERTLAGSVGAEELDNAE